MSTAAYGIPLALVTTSAFNTGLILEKRALTTMPALNMREAGRAIVSLLSSPAWLAGLALMLTGLACQVVVLTFEPISLVQPILASGVALTLVLSRLILRERLGGAESWCVAMLAVSLVLLAFSQDASARNTVQPPSTVAMMAATVPSVAAGLLVTAWPRRTARGRHTPAAAGTGIRAGIGIGLLYGVGALMTKGLSGILNHDQTAVSIGLGIASSPCLYVLVGCSAVALLLYQAALQAGRASVLIPVTNVASSGYFVIAGTWLFHEHLPSSPLRLGLRIAGIVAAGLVIAVLSRHAAEPQTHPRPQAQRRPSSITQPQDRGTPAEPGPPPPRHAQRN